MHDAYLFHLAVQLAEPSEVNRVKKPHRETELFCDEPVVFDDVEQNAVLAAKCRSCSFLPQNVHLNSYQYL